MGVEYGPAGRQAAADLSRAMRSVLQLRPVTAQGQVVAVQRDGNQRAISATVEVEGERVSATLVGLPVRVGDFIEIGREPGAAAGADWRFISYVSSLAQSPSLDSTADIPAPTWASPPLSSAATPPTLEAHGSLVVARLIETPERYGPAQMEIHYGTDEQAAAGAWLHVTVANEGINDALQEVTLNTIYGAGVTVNVMARTITNTGAVSPWSDLRSITTVGSTVVPTAPTILGVDVSNQFTAIITLAPPSQPAIFKHWLIRVATSAGGAGLQTYTTRNDQFIWTGPAGDIFLQVAEVTIADLVGPSTPTAGYQGPYTVSANGEFLDTTPPPVPTLQSFTSAVALVQGVTQVTLTVTLGAYAAPPDWRRHQVRLTITIGPTTTFEFHEFDTLVWTRYNAPQGATVSAAVRSFDQANNASAWSNTLQVVTPTVAAPPTPGGPPTTTGSFRAIIVSWAATPATTTTGAIASYEVQRSADGVTGWATIGAVAATFYVDAGLVGGTTWHYRYRPVTANGIPSAAYSPSASGVAGTVQNADIAANAITANQIQAGQVSAVHLATEILLATIIRASASGAIYAGGDTVRLAADGLRMVGRLLRFGRDIDDGAQDQWTMGWVDGFRGVGGYNGVAMEFIGAAQGADGQLIVWAKQAGAFAEWLQVDGNQLRFIRQSGGVGGPITAGAGVAWQGFTSSDGGSGGVYVPLDTATTHAIASPGGFTGYSVATWGIPASAKAIHCRITNTSPGNWLYAHGDLSVIELGLFITAGTTQTGNIVCEIDGGTVYISGRLPGGGNGPVSGILVPLGYYG